MSSVRTTVHESLPYIDAEPTPIERSAAQSLIDAELSSSPSTQPALPPLRPSSFSPSIEAELQRISASPNPSKPTPLDAIDLSRYEVQDSSSSSSSFVSPSDPQTIEPKLRLAYTANTYLSSRQTHLQLLDSYGKNAWLTANWQLEGELQSLERELAATKREIDVVNIQRRRVQDEVAAELNGLDETWRRGVGRVLEAEVAAEGLRHEVLERQRRGG